MAYASADDLVKRYDARTLGDLCSDTGVRVSEVALPTNPKILAALDDASGEIDAALMQAKRYTTADLASLTGNSLAYLKRLTCTIAFAGLWNRRPSVDDMDRDEALKQARQALDRLRRGENVFDLEDQKSAGLPEVKEPSVSSIDRLNLTVDRARRGYYPRRKYQGEG